MSMLFMSVFSLSIAAPRPAAPQPRDGLRCALRRRLQVEQAARRGLDPLLRGVVLEHQLLVGGSDAPGAGRHLGVELARTPAGVAHTEDRPAGPVAAGDRLENPRVIRDGEVL